MFPFSPSFSQVLQGFENAATLKVAQAEPRNPESQDPEPQDDVSRIEAEDVPLDEIDEIFVQPVETQADVKTTFGGDDGSIVLVPVDENGDPLQEPTILSEEPVTPFNQSGSLLFADLTTPAISLDRLEIPAKPNGAISYTLSPRERARARAAWAYFQNNRDETSGFARAVDTATPENRLSLWNVGSTLAAIESARTLGLISKADYDNDIRRIVANLSKVERFEGLPTQTFNASTGKAVGDKGVQAKDLSRLLVWLAAIKRNSPYLANSIDALVVNWNFCGVHDARSNLQNLASYSNKTYASPVQGLGYSAYAQKGFELWGFPAPELKVQAAPKQHRIHGVDLPTPADDIESLSFETFLLDGLEFGWDLANDDLSDYGRFTDGWRAEMAHRLFQAQFERYNTEGILTARAGHFIKQGDKLDYFENPVLNKGVGFLGSNRLGLAAKVPATLSTKAAFASWALWETPYSGLLFEAVADSFDAERGFPEAVYEGVGGIVDVYSLETNAYVLMSLAFNHQGALLPKDMSKTTSLWDRRRAKRIAQQRQCLPKPVAQRTATEDCRQTSPLPPLGFVYCSPERSSQPNHTCVACEKPQAVSNCSFFEQAAPKPSPLLAEGHSCGPVS